MLPFLPIPSISSSISSPFLAHFPMPDAARSSLLSIYFSTPPSYDWATFPLLVLLHFYPELTQEPSSSCSCEGKRMHHHFFLLRPLILTLTINHHQLTVISSLFLQLAMQLCFEGICSLPGGFKVLNLRLMEHSRDRSSVFFGIQFDRGSKVRGGEGRECTLNLNAFCVFSLSYK